MVHPLYVHAAQYRAKKRPETHILADIGLMTLSVLVAFLLARTHVLTSLLAATEQLKLIGTVIAGMFFTSVFTTAPAIATLGEISLSQPLLLTAILGAIGSVLGDLLIFRFVRDRIANDILELLKERSVFRRVGKLFKLRHFRWFTLLLGGLIIASPLPDELGIALLGFSKVKTRYFVVLSFTFNIIGIYLIGLTARVIAGV